jgi:hypothetical protein
MRSPVRYAPFDWPEATGTNLRSTAVRLRSRRLGASLLNNIQVIKPTVPRARACSKRPAMPIGQEPIEMDPLAIAVTASEHLLVLKSIVGAANLKSPCKSFKQNRLYVAIWLQGFWEDDCIRHGEVGHVWKRIHEDKRKVAVRPVQALGAMRPAGMPVPSSGCRFEACDPKRPDL